MKQKDPTAVVGSFLFSNPSGALGSAPPGNSALLGTTPLWENMLRFLLGSHVLFASTRANSTALQSQTVALGGG